MKISLFPGFALSLRVCVTSVVVLYNCHTVQVPHCTVL